MSAVLGCVDLSTATSAVVSASGRLARAMGGHLHLLHVAAPEPAFVGYDQEGGAYDRRARAEELTEERGELHRLAEGLERDGVEVTPSLVVGPTVDVILEQAERRDADLIVVGSHGHGAVHRLLVGSVTERLLRKSTRPVVVVPARR